uniref:UDP-glucuronosyltransferase n=1 Tax=Clastoptera arizonana TaxID=38151 RepID=A0A1B6E0P5_9HEMI
MSKIMLLLFLIGITNGYKILAFLPVPSNSFIRGFHPLLQKLANRGHFVTVYSIHPLEPPVPKNYNEVIVDNVFLNSEKLASILKTVTVSNNPWGSLQAQMVLGVPMSEAIFQLPQVQHLLASEENYDLVITCPFLAMESFMGFSSKFKAHTISVYANSPVPLHGYYSGDPPKYTYIPNLRFPYTNEMTLLERLENTLFGLYETVWSEMFYIPQQEALMHKYFTGLEHPPLSAMLRNISFYMYDITQTHSFIMPQLPNHIYIGGMTTIKHTSLPEDLQMWLDDSPYGVIFFSLGSNSKATDLPKDTLQIILNVFSKVQQKILMKWESDQLLDKPKNVKISKWLPQTDILAHSNCKLFITHGGMHSLIETVHFGVPFIGLPLFVDQEHNLMKLVEKGIGIYLRLENLSEDTLRENIREVITNRSFKENTIKLSKIMQDLPSTSLETAVFWTEYVLRHNGASHLRSSGLQLLWYQHHMLDIYFIIFILPILTVVILLYLIKKIVKIFKAKKIAKVNKFD